MAQKRPPSRAKRQVQVHLAPEDFAHLEQACLLFGVGKSDLIRRLVRASIEVGPALSMENGKALAAIGKELRASGRNIAQIVKGINLGYAPQLADDEALFRATHLALGEINATIQAVTVAYGSRLRRSAGLSPLPERQSA